MSNEHFDAGDACALLKVSHETLIELIRTEQLIGRRHPWGGWTVEKDSAVEYLHKLQQKGVEHGG